jgi:hypothetical protein
VRIVITLTKVCAARPSFFLFSKGSRLETLQEWVSRTSWRRRRRSTIPGLAQVLGNAEMMSEFNRLFGDLVDECEKLNQCVDHHGLQDRFLLLVVHHADTHIHVFYVECSVHGHIYLLC